MADPQCAHEFYGFLHSAPRITMVLFHTTDLKPLIERGGFESNQACSENVKRDGKCQDRSVLTEITARVMSLFKNKDRAERVITPLIYAMKFADAKHDLLPPSRLSSEL